VASEEIERRPDHEGRNTTTFPKEWGTPPQDAIERRAWIVENIIDGEERRTRGEHVPWLAERR
jgi:hypothetical protein